MTDTADRVSVGPWPVEAILPYTGSVVLLALEELPRPSADTFGVSGGHPSTWLTAFRHCWDAATVRFSGSQGESPVRERDLLVVGDVGYRSI